RLSAFLMSTRGDLNGDVRKFPLVVHARTSKDDLWVQLGGNRMVWWGEAPDAERPGGLSAPAKWSYLRDWIEMHPPEAWEAGPTQHFVITASGIRPYERARKEPPGSSRED